MIDKLISALEKLLDMAITWVTITGTFYIIYMGLKGLIVLLRLLF